MSRKLNTTTLVNGVIYAAGTAEADIAGADTVTAAVWDGEADAKPTFDPAKGGPEDVTMAYVGDDVERATALLTVEQAKGDKARKGVSEKLQAVIDAGSGS